jgi:hypothetical protein
MFALADATVALDVRLRCVRATVRPSIASSLRRAVRRISRISTSRRRRAERCLLHVVGHLPLLRARPDDPRIARLDRAALDVMADALALDAIACQESALHGLGHWRQV